MKGETVAEQSTAVNECVAAQGLLQSSPLMKLLTLACRRHFVAASLFAGSLVSPVFADTFSFSTGTPDGRISVGSRPDSAGKIEIEAADDFVLTQPTSLTSASFTGLLPSGASLGSVSDVTVEIYRVFPNDSDVSRTSGPPTFSTPQVPTRVNSPSDNALDSRQASAGNLTFTPAIVNSSFTANNSVLNGINPKPGQTTGGEGLVTGEEVTFNVAFTLPLDLPADHYFFVPQVQLSNGDFLWLSAPRPIVPPGTPFPAGSTDLQAWIRNANLDPDWLRVGTDIVGPGTNGSPAPTFNMAFSLAGTVPDAGTTAGLLGSVFAGIALARRTMRRAQ